jgi:8-amino-7-oxononanoate synthase
VGVLIPALVGEGDLILSDALSHASIIDGCKLSTAEVQVFAHNDVHALESLLQQARLTNRRILLIVDGVYSMDGDCAPLAEIQTLAKNYDAILFVDDTHGTGTVGPNGRGCPALHQLNPSDVDITLGSLAKALGSYGAFVGCSRTVRDLLINTCRSFIFSCALPPPQVEAARAALRVLQREPWRLENLQANAAHLRASLRNAGINTDPSITQIVPVIIGSNEDTMLICQDLLERGYFAQGIRFPSVPQGTARLRLTVMTSHDKENIDTMVQVLVDVLKQRKISLPPPEEHA